MHTSHALISATRTFDHSAANLFAHWTSPETRQRWEAGPDTGMRYDAFDTRDGGIETVRIFKDGKEVGQMVQSIYIFEPGKRIAYSVVGSFADKITTLMTVIVEFSDLGEGRSQLDALAMVADMDGKDVQSAHEAGWDWVLSRFAVDISAHGIVQA